MLECIWHKFYTTLRLCRVSEILYLHSDYPLHVLKYFAFLQNIIFVTRVTLALFGVWHYVKN